MLKIRLQRVGRKHDPSFRVVVTDSTRGPKSGNFIEILGNYDARQKDKTQLNVERIKHWISNGAKLSDTVHNLLINHNIIKGKKINVLPKKTPQISEEELKKQQKEKEEVKDPKPSDDKVKSENKEAEITTDKVKEVKEDKDLEKEEVKKETEKKDKIEGQQDKVNKTEAELEEKEKIEKTEELEKIAPAKPAVKEEEKEKI